NPVPSGPTSGPGVLGASPAARSRGALRDPRLCWFPGVRCATPGSVGSRGCAARPPALLCNPFGVKTGWERLSVPDVPLVVLDPVFPEDAPHLVLKRTRLMVPLLPGDVPRHHGDVRRAYGKGPVAVLPVEVGEVGALALDPLRGFAFQLADEVG